MRGFAEREAQHNAKEAELTSTVGGCNVSDMPVFVLRVVRRIHYVLFDAFLVLRMTRSGLARIL